MKKSLIFMVIIALLAMLTIGCTVETSQSPVQEQDTASLTDELTTSNPVSAAANGEKNFRLLISDEENDIGNFETLNVTISRIGVHNPESGNWTEWYVSEEEGTVNLTTLQGINATSIWNGHLEDGTYNKVFIYVSNVTGILNPGINETDPIVKLPGGKLQISKSFTINSSSMTNFVYDVTVIKAGNSGKYILKPQAKESGADKKFNDVGLKGKSEGKGKPEVKGKSEDKGKPENKGKPEDKGKPGEQTSGSLGDLDEDEGEDTTAPVITVFGVSHGANYTGNVTFSFNATDDSGLAPAVNATLTVNSTLTIVLSNSTFEVSGIGEYELEVKAIDASGNEAERTIKFEIKQ